MLIPQRTLGRERGALAGAVELALSLLATADTDTVFFDEIGDLSLEGQAMLLRFLQEREVWALGSTRTIRVDVRVIAATNRDLEAAVGRGEFRADLYDRINEVALTAAPCRRAYRAAKCPASPGCPRLGSGAAARSRLAGERP